MARHTARPFEATTACRQDAPAPFASAARPLAQSSCTLIACRIRRSLLALQMLLGAVALYDSPVTAADVPPVSHDEDSHAMLSLLEFNRLAAAAVSEAHKLPFLDMPGK